MAIRAGINIITKKLVHLRLFSAQKRLLCNFCVTIKMSAHCFEHWHTWMPRNNINISLCGVQNVLSPIMLFYYYLWVIRNCENSCLSSFEIKKASIWKKTQLVYSLLCTLYGRLALSKMVAPVHGHIAATGQSAQRCILSMILSKWWQKCRLIMIFALV